MSIHIIFSSNSIRNTTASCDSLGIHYTVSKPDRIASLSRWDSASNTDVIVGQFELPFFHKDRIRVGPNGDWQPLRDFLDRMGIFSHSLTFTANDGVQYKWKCPWIKLLLTRGSSDERLITYHRMCPGHSYLEVSDSSVLRGLDIIMLVFLIAERKRRNRRRRRHASGGGGP